MADVTERTPRHYPWYKERLRWKYLANQQRQLNTLISHKWRFFPKSNNLQDPIRSDFPEKKPPLVLPLINPRPLVVQQITRSKNNHSTHRTDEETRQLLSKLSPGQQARLDRVNKIEEDLLMGFTEEDREQADSPAADKVTDDKHVRNSANAHHTLEVDSEFLLAGEDEQEDDEVTQQNSEEQSTIYKWPLLKSAQELAEEELEMAKQRAVSPTQEAHVNHVTHELIEWSRKLGDEKEYIDEATIKRLFACDYEAKPILTASIHVVEPKNIPPELRTESRGYTSSSYRAMSAIERIKLQEFSPPPKCVRYKYGAWYLKPSLWKLRPWTEPLEDPKVIKKREEMEIRMKNESLDAVLSETHGAQAFRDFVANRYKDTRTAGAAAMKPTVAQKSKIRTSDGPIELTVTNH